MSEKVIHQHYSCDWCGKSFSYIPCTVDMSGIDIYGVCAECFAGYEAEMAEGYYDWTQPDMADPDVEEI